MWRRQQTGWNGLKEKQGRGVGPELKPFIFDIFFHIPGGPFIKIGVFGLPAVNKRIANGHAYTSIGFGSFYGIHLIFFDGDCGELIRMPWGVKKFLLDHRPTRPQSPFLPE